MPKVPHLPAIKVVLPTTPPDLADYVGQPVGLCTLLLADRPGKMPYTFASWRGIVCNHNLEPRADRTNLHVDQDGIVVALEWG